MAKQITIIGTGYVGLTTGACLAYLGHQVVCIDTNVEKIAELNSGICPIYEKGLPDLLAKGLETERLSFSDTADTKLLQNEFIFLCLPTPQAEDGRAELSAIYEVAESLKSFLSSKAIVVNKSTVPVGTCKVISQIIGREDIDIVSNPEFLREGSAIEDFLKPDRIIIGANAIEASDRVAELYSNLESPIIQVDWASAETVKYATNSFLAMKVSFVNALAAVCEAVGADIELVAKGLGTDNRIGSKFLQPGPGWGGSCFPKDMQALVRLASDSGYKFELLEAVVDANAQQFKRIAEKVEKAVGKSLEGVHVAVLGLTFKAGTDDIRNSPAIAVSKLLSELGAQLNFYDPLVESLPEELSDGIVHDSAEKAVTNTEVIVILTEWPEFKDLDWIKFQRIAKSSKIVDARNLLNPQTLRDIGFEYASLGRK
ncbi:MAG: UDPglucose 6-dehydrogenase [Candidatus Poriferisodalaceae bacterium]|jgi:UDPglucose 6-dehydrogenase|tara:strand:- start:27481 stop:28764 length:1284 start_codon:yes stop_codon:yes gene_type:complete